MAIVEVNGKKYNSEDIDCNGRPYEDAIEVLEFKVNWKTLYSGVGPFELKGMFYPYKPNKIGMDFGKDNK
jgi:hypothetical protein